MNEAAVLTAVEAFGRVDFAAADEATGRELLAHSRPGRGPLDAADAQLLSRLGELHTDHGGAPPADVVATTCGGCQRVDTFSSRRINPAIGMIEGSFAWQPVRDGGRQLDLADGRLLTMSSPTAGCAPDVTPDVTPRRKTAA